ncbi:Psf2-domain-containing protein [Terfezia boudieri ATCC MYA-4762]|uniref:DNA replication complex GINS protein PSF2 n=1 Tax=Terfezia boudieri ATCC MYA-4762 TaxID=1051890 RepID=A0A3N4LFS3_9PEZI|nr:Psf2-domain-containing protein [Terfezia boudieri ATCC MYA-4762]
MSLSPLTPAEHLYLTELLPITIIPRVHLPSLPLISGPLPPLRPPHRAHVPLWLALLLKRQKKANIVPPAWLNVDNLERLIKWEQEHPERFTEELPWEWVELGEVLVEGAEDDLVGYAGGGGGVGGGGVEGDIRVLLRTLREVRWSKVREGLRELDSTYLKMNGLGHLEISELRPFAKAVVDNLRHITSSKEEARLREERDEEEEGRRAGRRGRVRGEEDDDDEF